MTSTSEKIQQIFEIFKAEAADLWEHFREDEEKFLRDVAEDIAHQGVKYAQASLAGDTKEMELRAQNLKLLSATAQAEIVRQQLRLSARGKEILPKIIGAVARTVLDFNLFGA